MKQEERNELRRILGDIGNVIVAYDTSGGDKVKAVYYDLEVALRSVEAKTIHAATHKYEGVSEKTKL